MSCPRCMRRSTTARGTPMYGTRRMRWRANSRQMTRPSRRRSEETMNERASSCVRAPMSRHCRAASQSAATYIAARPCARCWRSSEESAARRGHGRGAEQAAGRLGSRRDGTKERAPSRSPSMAASAVHCRISTLYTLST